MEIRDLPPPPKSDFTGPPPQKANFWGGAIKKIFWRFAPIGPPQSVLQVSAHAVDRRNWFYLGNRGFQDSVLASRPIF